jgi:hypothetical protein
MPAKQWAHLLKLSLCAFSNLHSLIRALCVMQAAKVETAKTALEAAKIGGDSQKVKELGKMLAGEELKLRQASETREAATCLALKDNSSADPADIATKFRDVLAEHLDSSRGAEVTDKDIYRCEIQPCAFKQGQTPRFVGGGRCIPKTSSLRHILQN